MPRILDLRTKKDCKSFKCSQITDLEPSGHFFLEAVHFGWVIFWTPCSLPHTTDTSPCPCPLLGNIIHRPVPNMASGGIMCVATFKGITACTIPERWRQENRKNFKVNIHYRRNSTVNCILSKSSSNNTSRRSSQSFTFWRQQYSCMHQCSWTVLVLVMSLIEYDTPSIIS